MTTKVQVNGIATPGQTVSFFDMANQDGTVWEVMTTPEDNINPRFGWTKGYGLTDPATGAIRYSDLRQSGWTFTN